MNQELINAIILATSYLLLIGLAELLYRRFKIHPEITRKLVHTGGGFLSILLPILIESHWTVLVLALIMTLLISKKGGGRLLKSIHGIERNSLGGVIFPLSVYLIFLIYSIYDQYLFFYLPLIILTISDPIATLAGKKLKIFHYKIWSGKTLIGSAAFFISTSIICILLFAVFSNIGLTYLLSFTLIIGVTTTLVEAVSTHGFDNLSIPIAVLIILSIFEQYAYLQ